MPWWAGSAWATRRARCGCAIPSRSRCGSLLEIEFAGSFPHLLFHLGRVLVHLFRRNTDLRPISSSDGDVIAFCNRHQVHVDGLDNRLRLMLLARYGHLGIPAASGFVDRALHGIRHDVSVRIARPFRCRAARPWFELAIRPTADLPCRHPESRRDTSGQAFAHRFTPISAS